METQPTDQHVKAIQNINSLIKFKEALLQLTTDEITNLKAEIEYVKERADYASQRAVIDQYIEKNPDVKRVLV